MIRLTPETQALLDAAIEEAHILYGKPGAHEPLGATLTDEQVAELKRLWQEKVCPPRS
jgi:hypothetical protein